MHIITIHILFSLGRKGICNLVSFGFVFSVFSLSISIYVFLSARFLGLFRNIGTLKMNGPT